MAKTSAPTKGKKSPTKATAKKKATPPKASATKKPAAKVVKKPAVAKAAPSKKASATPKKAAPSPKKKAAPAPKAAVPPKKKAVVPKKAAAPPPPLRPIQMPAVTEHKSAQPQTSTRTGLRPTARDAARDATKKLGKTSTPPAPAPVTAPAPAPARPARRTSQAKPLPREFLLDLCNAIRHAVTPSIKSVKGREVIGHATSGDATFEIDRIAEKALLNFLKDVKAPVAYYSEDAGYTTFSSGQPQHLLIVDPIDGTRAAKCGFESCVVSVGCTRVIERPCMADIESACVLELLGDRSFYAERGKGTRIYTGDQWKKATLSQNTNLETVSWSMTVPARPADLIFPTAAKLIDLTSLKGGFFACNSTSFSLTRLLTNQLDACVDIANRYLRDIPEAVEGKFVNAGRGIVLGIAPYDIAASLLIAQEAGCVVTDAYGNNFNDILLLDSSVGNHRSLIAAANPELHKKLLGFFDMRIRQYELLLSRRAGATVGR